MIRGPQRGRGPDGASESSPSGNIPLREIAEEKVLQLQVIFEFWRLFALFCTRGVCGWMKMPLVFGYCPVVLLGLLGVPVVALALGMSLLDIVMKIVLPGLFALLLTEGRTDV